MAIVGPWVGSSAVAETGSPWMSVAGSRLSPALNKPFWMSNMIGRSVDIKETWGYQFPDGNFHPDTFNQWLQDRVSEKGGRWTNAQINIIFTGRAVSASTLHEALWFGGTSHEQVAFIQLNFQNALLFGRGGNGAGWYDDWQSPGKPGGHAIYNGIGQKLRISWSNNIYGGGGGGGLWFIDTDNQKRSLLPGGGGRPWGTGGRIGPNPQPGYTFQGGDANWDFEGRGALYANDGRGPGGGDGGNLGQQGVTAWGGSGAGITRSAGGPAGLKWIGSEPLLN